MSHNTSYIDGISVKISEKYKPPKRIALALSYSQRMTLNKLLQDPFPNYDFSLEESVKTRVREWRKLRTVERIKPQENCTETNTKSTYYETGVLIPNYVESQQVKKSQSRQVDNFNFSEFESDTSSPFDNMELKTINDLEQLAEVLNRENSNLKKPSQINGYFTQYSPQLTSTQGLKTPTRSVTEIMKALQEELENNHISEKISSEKSSNSEDLQENLFGLDEKCREMVKTISSMGFPLERVARTCQMFDGNQKKIVEHLLAMSDLLDLGFPEQKAADALLKCNNDRDKALDLLVS